MKNTNNTIASLIKDALYSVDDDYNFIDNISTSDDGIVIDMADGSEFHITIQRSR